jgi:hypothetical protein
MTRRIIYKQRGIMIPLSLRKFKDSDTRGVQAGQQVRGPTHGDDAMPNAVLTSVYIQWVGNTREKISFQTEK